MMNYVDFRKYSEQNDKFSWMLNIIDTYTKYLCSFKIKHKTAENVQKILNQIFINYGISKEIQSDNGKDFSNNLLRQFLRQLNIRIIHGRSRNHKAQSQVERVNQTIKK